MTNNTNCIDWRKTARCGALVTVSALRWLTLNGGQLLLTCANGLDQARKQLRPLKRAKR